MTQSNWMSIFIIIGLFICLLVGACDFYGSNSSVPVSEISAETEDRDILEANAEIKIPENATDIHGYVDGFQEIVTYVRFTIPSNKLDEFLKSTSCNLPLSVRALGNNEHSNEYISWWEPSEAKRLHGCEGAEEHLIQNIFVDRTDPDSYIIYVVASTR